MNNKQLVITNKIIGALSIIFGIYILYSHIQIIHNYVTNPDTLWLFIIPYDDLIIEILFGMLLMVGGVLILINNKLFHLFYSILGSGLIFYPLLNFTEFWIKYQLNFNLLYYILIYAFLGLFVLYFSNRKKQLKTYKIELTKNYKIIILATSFICVLIPELML